MRNKILITTFLGAVMACTQIWAQLIDLSNVDLGEIHGNFNMEAQYYRDDSLIGAPKVPEQIRYNGFLNLNYTKGNFRAGLRYESYQKALLGYSPDYEGNGIPYRYAGYKIGEFDFTAGNFYDPQIFRSGIQSKIEIQLYN